MLRRSGVCVPAMVLVGLLFGFAFLPPTSEAAVYPLAVSSNGRYLIDQTGQPFFWAGDTAWSLIAQLTLADAEHYLENRRQKGFNVVLVNLLEHAFATNASANIFGESPFSGTPFITPNAAYFAHADAVITAAAQRGIVVLLAPLYLGYGCGSQGWCAEVKAASVTAMRTWGQYVGNRYKNFDNIVWLIGGDTDPTPVLDKVSAFVTGLREFDTRHLITAHNWRGSFAITPWPSASWLTVNNVYASGPTIYQNSKTAYNRSPVLPFFLLEGIYENEHSSTPQGLRAENYWLRLSGGLGGNFGNCPIWHFGYSSSWCGLTNWKAQLDGPGSIGVSHAKRLFTSRAWHTLVPDFDHTVLTAGYGTWGANDYAAAARTADGASVIAYLPTARTVTVDLTRLSGSQAKAWWYNPASGISTSIGTFANSGPHTFTPPGSGDWVLLLDDASRNLPAPGSVLPVAPNNLRVH